MVKVAGTVIGLSEPGEPGGRQFPVRAVHGSVVVASTMPGRIPPTTEPMPGKLPAAPKLPPADAFAPSVKVHPGQPNMLPRAPGPCPKVPADPPTNGNCTNGWLNAGRKTAVPAILSDGLEFGASTIAGPLPRNPPKFNCEFGR